jgi:hypothetical protein
MKLQDENQNINPMKTSNAETIILCDSNGRNLDPKLLCPNSTTEYVRCRTIEADNKILEQHQFSNPKTFIIHTSTNDIERCSIDSISNKTKTLLSSIRQKHPQACLILSSLLPRNDHLLQKAKTRNDRLEKFTNEFPNTTILKHTNLFESTQILYDKKHLNHKGVKIFAKNLKSAYFGTKRKHYSPKPKPLFHPPTNKQFTPNHRPHQPYHHVPHPGNYNQQFPPLPRNGNPNTWKRPLDNETSHKVSEMIKILHSLFQ